MGKLKFTSPRQELSPRQSIDLSIGAMQGVFRTELARRVAWLRNKAEIGPWSEAWLRYEHHIGRLLYPEHDWTDSSRLFLGAVCRCNPAVTIERLKQAAARYEGGGRTELAARCRRKIEELELLQERTQHGTTE